MSRKSFYLKDRARITRYAPNYNKRVVDTEAPPIPVGDWIRARLRPVAGEENRQDVTTKLVYSYELVLHKFDESGNPVVLDEADEFEMRVMVDGELTPSEDKLIITGAVDEVRRNSRVSSYVMPVAWETEQ